MYYITPNTTQPYNLYFVLDIVKEIPSEAAGFRISPFYWEPMTKTQMLKRFKDHTCVTRDEWIKIVGGRRY